MAATSATSPSISASATADGTFEAPRQHSVFRVAIGLLSAEGLFAPIAHSQAVRMPPHQASGDTSIEWLHVPPLRGTAKRVSASSLPVSRTASAAFPLQP